MSTKEISMPESIRRNKSETNDFIANRSHIYNRSAGSSPKSEFYSKGTFDRSTNIRESLGVIGEEKIMKRERSKMMKNLRMRSATEAYHSKMMVEKAEKIFESLCKPIKSPPVLVDKQSIKLAMPHAEVYKRVSEMYDNMKRHRKTKNVEEIINLIEVLKSINCLFCKVSDIFSICLLKKGKIHRLKENETLYRQNEERNSIFLILWGEIKLKEIYKNKVKYCIPGDMLCEEAILEQRKRNELFSNINVVKGNHITKETAKCMTQCGIFELTKDAYDDIKNTFAENGEKEKTFVFDRIITWSLSKKSKFRK